MSSAMPSAMPSASVFDYIIIGAGSAGCVVANRLSANPKNRVLLLEAGKPDTNPWIHVPVGYFKTMHNPALDWCYVTEPDPGLNHRTLKWPRGKVYGGSSSLNGLLYIRGQKQDYDHWAALGNHGWAWSDVLPYFIKSEDQERGAMPFHGIGGAQKVSDISLRRPVTTAFIEAAKQAGIPYTEDFNGADQEGVGYFQLTTHKGMRWSTAKGFLRPAMKRKNLTVIANAHTSKVLFENNKACGVEYLLADTVKHAQKPAHKPEIKIARCNREVILCGGAIGSPQILQLSGIGPGALLQDKTIALQKELKGVGENLKDHLQIRAVYKTKSATLNDEISNPFKKFLIGLEYICKRTGAMTLAASQVAIFTKSAAAVKTPDIQFHFQPLSSDNPGEGTHSFSAFTSSVCQLRPTSAGRIAIKSADPLQHPAIHPNYLATDLDCHIAVQAMKISRKIASMPALKSEIQEEFDPGADVVTDDQLLQHARNTATTIYHPVGSCKMGAKSDAYAVVDHRLRVHGIHGLRIADASIMPEIVSGNTNAPCIMIGEKCADMVLQDAASHHPSS